MRNTYMEKDSLKPWTVGVLFSETGVTSIIEKTQLKGTLLAIDAIVIVLSYLLFPYLWRS